MKLPSQIFEQHIAVLGKTGSGKSSALRYCVEHLLDEQKPVCIIDPKGDWWGLKSSASGKSAGYPVVIFGGEHADVPLNEHSGKHIAELIAIGNRPCIIDLGGWMVGERTRFFVDFASTLFRTTRGKRYIVIDEVHNFAPQQKIEKNPDAMKMKHWANRLASEGRGKGLTILSASQRPQKVDKDFLTCAETLVAMRVIHKLDRDAIKDWIDGAGDPAKGKEVLDTLANNERGEAWLWSPEAKFGPKRFTFPMFKTYDSFAADANTGTSKLKGWASVDLDEVSAKLAATIEEAKANDPAELKKQIAELKRQVAAKPTAEPDSKSIERAVASAVAERDRHWKGQLAEAVKAHGSVVGKLTKIHQLSTLNGDATIAVAKPADITVHIPRTIRQTAPQRPVQQPVVDSGDVQLSKAERAILTALYWLRDEQVTPAKVAFYSDYSAGSSTTNNALGRLRHGLVSGWRITTEGVAMVESWGVRPKPKGDELVAMIGGKLGRAERAMFDALLEVHPNRLTGPELSEACGYSFGSSTFNNAIGKLRTLECAEGYERDGGTKAADVFFEG